jgi:hypothetical protein
MKVIPENTTVFWYVTACSLVEKYQLFGEIFCLYLSSLTYPEKGDSRFLRKVDTSLPGHTSSLARGRQSS